MFLGVHHQVGPHTSSWSQGYGLTHLGCSWPGLDDHTLLLSIVCVLSWWKFQTSEIQVVLGFVDWWNNGFGEQI